MSTCEMSVWMCGSVLHAGLAGVQESHGAGMRAWGPRVRAGIAIQGIQELRSQPCECRVCVSLSSVLKNCYCLNLETWKLESPTLTSRSPGTPTWEPEDKEEESPGPGVYPRQQPYNSSQHSHSSIRKCRQYSYFCGPNLISFLLVFQKSVFNYMTSFFFSYSVFKTDDVYLMSCCASFFAIPRPHLLCGIQTLKWGWSDSFPMSQLREYLGASYSSHVFLFLQMWDLSEKSQVQFNAYVLAIQGH